MNKNKKLSILHLKTHFQESRETTIDILCFDSGGCLSWVSILSLSKRNVLLSVDAAVDIAER